MCVCGVLVAAQNIAGGLIKIDTPETLARAVSIANFIKTLEIVSRSLYMFRETGSHSSCSLRAHFFYLDLFDFEFPRVDVYSDAGVIFCENSKYFVGVGIGIYFGDSKCLM